MSARRFPPPWTAEITPNCFIVRDANGQQLAYIYYECEPGRRSAAKLLSEDEARRIASNMPSCRSFCESRKSAELILEPRLPLPCVAVTKQRNTPINHRK